MGQTHYEGEIERFPSTYAEAVAAEVSNLKAAIAGVSESSVIGVGSGGSFTVASLLCNLHEAYTGRVSRPSTPLEIICNPTLAASSPVFLVSAEGQNPDITEALKRARLNSARNVHVLTNRSESPLMECARMLTDVSSHVFELAHKDGYLATNSLLLDAVLIARAYGELDQSKDNVPSRIEDLRIAGLPVDDWVAQASVFAAEAASRGSLTVIYSPLLRPIAADLESKLSEAALLHCQVADLRSYAHGRHLWLSDRPQDCAILAITEPSLGELWTRMRTLVPASVPTLTMPLDGSLPRDLIAGLIAQMHLVAFFASNSGKDPGRPKVPQFGRELYYVDLTDAIPPSIPASDGVEASKHEVLGARWPSVRRNGPLTRARADFCGKLAKQVFRALVFDYDGTLCSSHRHDSPPPGEILEKIGSLVELGVVIGIASGRGGSVQECLSQALAPDALSKIHLGLYNGGWIAPATVAPAQSNKTSEFLSHVTRICGRLRSLGVPIDLIRPTHPYQVSVRFRDGVATEQMWFVVADALRQAGLDLSSIVRSKHSIDILAAHVNKSRVIAHVIREAKIDPYSILTMGDQGAWPGNDSSLLEHRFSLSVDVPSRRIDRGWKLAPKHKRDVDAALWYLDRIKIGDEGRFSISC